MKGKIKKHKKISLNLTSKITIKIKIKYPYGNAFGVVIVIRRFRSLNIPEYILINCNGYYNGTFLLVVVVGFGKISCYTARMITNGLCFTFFFNKNWLTLLFWKNNIVCRVKYKKTFFSSFLFLFVLIILLIRILSAFSCLVWTTK